MLHVRICAGGGQQCPSLPRCFFSGASSRAASRGAPSFRIPSWGAKPGLLLHRITVTVACTTFPVDLGRHGSMDRPVSTPCWRPSHSRKQGISHVLTAAKCSVEEASEADTLSS
jgi:hypothetical protein